MKQQSLLSILKFGCLNTIKQLQEGKELLDMCINFMSQNMKFYSYVSSVGKVHVYALKRVNSPLKMERNYSIESFPIEASWNQLL